MAGVIAVDKLSGAVVPDIDPASGDPYVPIANSQFADLREMAFEILCSPSLRGFLPEDRHKNAVLAITAPPRVALTTSIT